MSCRRAQSTEKALLHTVLHKDSHAGGPRGRAGTHAAELVALARAQPGTLTFGFAGGGSPSRIASELFRSLAGIDMAHLPLSRQPALLPGLLAGHLTVAFPNIVVVLQQVREGRLRALARHLAEARGFGA